MRDATGEALREASLAPDIKARDHTAVQADIEPAPGLAITTS